MEMQLLKVPLAPLPNETLQELFLSAIESARSQSREREISIGEVVIHTDYPQYAQLISVREGTAKIQFGDSADSPVTSVPVSELVATIDIDPKYNSLQRAEFKRRGYTLPDEN